MIHNLFKALLCWLFLFSMPCFAETAVIHRPFYVGITGGYGSTTWGRLVADDQNAAIILSTPTSASDTGGTWGLMAGYEFMSSFALEASYVRYADTTVVFDDMSIFAYNYGFNTLTTHTETVTLSAKFMLTIPRTNVRAFSSFGAAEVHRNDAVLNRWELRPAFGLGLNYDITDRLMLELGGIYVAGDAESELDPAVHYIPFVYSGYLGLAFRF